MSTVDESLAKALGWERTQGVHGKETVGYWRKGEDWYCDACGNLPNWSESFDACLRDIVPVLRARGFEVAADLWDETSKWDVIVRAPHSTYSAENVSLPAAFCEAALAALEATNG